MIQQDSHCSATLRSLDLWRSAKAKSSVLIAALEKIQSMESFLVTPLRNANPIESLDSTSCFSERLKNRRFRSDLLFFGRARRFCLGDWPKIVARREAERNRLSSKREKMKPKVTIYTKHYCPYCEAAKRLLKSKGVSYEEINVTNNPEELESLIRKTNHQTVPQIFIGEKFVGGFDELEALDKASELDKLLGK